MVICALKEVLRVLTWADWAGRSKLDVMDELRSQEEKRETARPQGSELSFKQGANTWECPSAGRDKGLQRPE